VGFLFSIFKNYSVCGFDYSAGHLTPAFQEKVSIIINAIGSIVKYAEPVATNRVLFAFGKESGTADYRAILWRVINKPEPARELADGRAEVTEHVFHHDIAERVIHEKNIVLWSN
jgi:hypothetical protein